VLVVVSVAMVVIARPYYRTIAQATELRPSGVPRVSDEDSRAPAVADANRRRSARFRRAARHLVAHDLQAHIATATFARAASPPPVQHLARRL